MPYGAPQTKVNKGGCPPETPPTNTPLALWSHPEGNVPQYSIGLCNYVPNTWSHGQGTALKQAINDSDRPGVKLFQSLVDTINGKDPLTILSWVAHDSDHDPGDLFYFSGDIAHNGNTSSALLMHSASEAYINTLPPTGTYLYNQKPVAFRTY
ncbi:hypothetical protein I350_07354 [Cryptococcus amylolentus CBS 6273]|uniref:Uncharacterized protein n=1 Tax=Cryptococcus amylolentus CBS 6273 TaxID=1296118 RepID=A0A1E3JEU5_9TREE|nr:hypothetical protein I350_07354 [Cryptococcus amylolentus CBS 6273]